MAVRGLNRSVCSDRHPGPAVDGCQWFMEIPTGRGEDALTGCWLLYAYEYLLCNVAGI